MNIFSQDLYRFWARAYAGLYPVVDAAIAAEFAYLDAQSVINEQY